MAHELGSTYLQKKLNSILTKKIQEKIPEIKNTPSGENYKSFTYPIWPKNCLISTPSFKFHNFMDQSDEPRYEQLYLTQS